MKATTTGMLALACTLVLAASAAAQGTMQTPNAPKTDIPANLAREAKISLDSARAITMHKIPTGTIQAQELERENGRLIYSFDVKVPGKSGISEVNVNAKDGAVVGMSHEGATTEAREARQEKKEAKKP